jgi:hypothetical protein
MFKIPLFISAFALAGAVSFADQSATEHKAETTAHDAKRSMKKAGHRVTEAVCAEGDAACLARKAKHRTEEGGDYVKDKAKETKDKND